MCLIIEKKVELDLHYPEEYLNVFASYTLLEQVDSSVVLLFTI